MGHANYPLIKQDLLRIHIEDAAFLYGLRSMAVEAPNYRLVDIYDLESRIEGHLAAAAMAGEAAARLAQEELETDPTPGTCFVMAHLTLRGGRSACFQAALGHAGDDPALLAGVAGGASWCARDRIALHMRDWITSADPARAWLALEVCGQHRVDPGEHLGRMLQDKSALVRERAWRLAGEIGRADLLKPAMAALEQDTPEFEAAWSACLLGDRAEAPRCLASGLLGGLPAPLARRAAEIVSLCLPEDEVKLLVRRLVASPRTARWGIVALGAFGRAEALPWLCARMHEPLTARAAGSAFERITGVHIGLAGLELDEFPDDPENPMVDEEPVERFIESGSPWPDPERVGSWIDTNAVRFNGETRYLFGVAAWTRADFEGSDIKYQARFRAVACDISLRAPERRLPNWHGRVALREGQFVRDW